MNWLILQDYQASGQNLGWFQGLSVPICYILASMLFEVYSNMLHLVDCHFPQEWTKLEKTEGAPWPGERHSHAACCLNYGEKHPQLLISGGLDINDKSLADAWILDINSKSWNKVRVGGEGSAWDKLGSKLSTILNAVQLRWVKICCWQASVVAMHKTPIAGLEKAVLEWYISQTKMTCQFLCTRHIAVCINMPARKFKVRCSEITILQT